MPEKLCKAWTPVDAWKAARLRKVYTAAVYARDQRGEPPPVFSSRIRAGCPKAIRRGSVRRLSLMGIPCSGFSIRDMPS